MDWKKNPFLFGILWWLFVLNNVVYSQVFQVSAEDHSNCDFTGLAKIGKTKFEINSWKLANPSASSSRQLVAKVGSGKYTSGVLTIKLRYQLNKPVNKSPQVVKLIRPSHNDACAEDGNQLIESLPKSSVSSNYYHTYHKFKRKKDNAGEYDILESFHANRGKRSFLFFGKICRRTNSANVNHFSLFDPNPKPALQYQYTQFERGVYRRKVRHEKAIGRLVLNLPYEKQANKGACISTQLPNYINEQNLVSFAYHDSDNAFRTNNLRIKRHLRWILEEE